MERERGQATGGWRGARATAPGRLWLPAPSAQGEHGNAGGPAPSGPCGARLAGRHWSEGSSLHRPAAGPCESAVQCRGTPRDPKRGLGSMGPVCYTASVNRKSTSGSCILFGSGSAQGIPPPLLTALQNPSAGLGKAQP